CRFRCRRRLCAPTARGRGRNKDRTLSCRARLQPFRQELRVGILRAYVLQLRRQHQGAKPRGRPLRSDYPPTRNARANVRTQTDAAPARFSTRAHSSTVAPVVMTSSITTTRFPAKLRPAWTANAPRTLRSRAACPRWPCDGVRRRRTRRSAATSGPPAERIARANSAAWLYRL